MTQENRKLYARKVAKYYLIKEVQEELKEFTRGFYQVLPSNIISVFDEDELDFIIKGVPHLSLDDWKANTLYRGDYTSNHRVIKWFWEHLATFSQDDLRKLLLFCTGMPRVPIDGFKAL